jgi:hypothetical protein
LKLLASTKLKKENPEELNKQQKEKWRNRKRKEGRQRERERERERERRVSLYVYLACDGKTKKEEKNKRGKERMPRQKWFFILCFFKIESSRIQWNLVARVKRAAEHVAFYFLYFLHLPFLLGKHV